MHFNCEDAIKASHATHANHLAIYIVERVPVGNLILITANTRVRPGMKELPGLRDQSTRVKADRGKRKKRIELGRKTNSHNHKGP